LKKGLAINYREQDTLLLDTDNMSKSENSSGLIHLCIENNLIIANTIFPHTKQLMYTEVEASENKKSILDYIVVRKESRKFIIDTKGSKRSEINSDHCLHVMEMDITNLKKKKKRQSHRIKQKLL
jgi:hypothetical protein